MVTRVSATILWAGAYSYSVQRSKVITLNCVRNHTDTHSHTHTHTLVLTPWRVRGRLLEGGSRTGAARCAGTVSSKSGREHPARWERLTSLATIEYCSPRERVLGTCVRPGVAEPDCEPVEG